MKHPVLSALAALCLTAPCAELFAAPAGLSPEAYLERQRLAFRDLRTSQPEALTVGSGNAAFAKKVFALGEGEEFDVWLLPDTTSVAEENDLRAYLDGVGGRATRLMRQHDYAQWNTPRYLVAGSGRLTVLGANRQVRHTKVGCGNIHRVRYHKGFFYYSNGALWRFCSAALGRSDAVPELVYHATNEVGGAVLGFDVTSEGTAVMALNSQDEVIEMDLATKRILTRFPVDARAADGTLPQAHLHLRMIRKTQQGTYLVCAAGAAMVREYDRAGKLVWEQSAPPFVFDCLRLASGNTLVSHLTGLTEFTPKHEAVWSVKCSDLPQLHLEYVAGVESTETGNYLVGTWANGRSDGSRTTTFRLARDKKVVWSIAACDDVNMMDVVELPNGL